MKAGSWLIGLCLVLAACQTGQPPGGSQNQKPSALFSASKTAGVAPLSVDFSASASTDADGVIASYSWTFGDGRTASGQGVTHTFMSAGRFTVRLTVTDNQGAKDSADQVVNITGEDGNVSPAASFTATPAEGNAPLTVSFNASASSDADGAITAYSWTFGDGGSGAGETVSHTFENVGTFNVTLRVTDNGGATASVQETIVVTSGDTPGGDDQEVKTTGALFTAAEATPRLSDVYLVDGVDIALLATQLTGSSTLVFTGTVTQTGPNSYSYDPVPNDRLKAVLLDGREFEMVFTQLQGDFSSDGSNFMSQQHRAAAHVSSNAAAGSLDLTLQSVKLNGNQERLIQGAFTDENSVRWTVNVKTEGTYISEVDIGTARLESDDVIQGTLQAEALGVSVTLNKRYVYKMLNDVENVRHLIDHSWTWNGSTYGLQLEVFVAFDEAQPVDTDQWIIQGGLARDGLVIGQVQTADDPTGLSIWLQIGLERLDLFFFSYL